MWKSDFFAWNETEYGGIQSVRIPSDKIWIPDILPYNE